MKDDPHPLTKWLKAKKIKPLRFAATNGIKPRGLYYVLNGRSENPGHDIMLAIEKGTGGRVSLKKQSEWLQRRNGV